MDLLTKEEAAAFLHIPVNTLSHWVALNQGPRSAKIGRRRMWRKSDCEAWLNKQFDAA